MLDTILFYNALHRSKYIKTEDKSMQKSTWRKAGLKWDVYLYISKVQNLGYDIKIILTFPLNIDIQSRHLTYHLSFYLYLKIKLNPVPSGDSRNI